MDGRLTARQAIALVLEVGSAELTAEQAERVTDDVLGLLCAHGYVIIDAMEAYGYRYQERR